MSDILERIIADKRVAVDRSKRLRPQQNVQALAEMAEPAPCFLEALTKNNLGPRIIAECKKQSPSKGVLCDPYNPTALASAYERGGAAAISVLTDEPYFGGKLQDLEEVSDLVNIPVLRKDFIIDEYQIYEARASGAASFLLLAGVLDTAKIQYFVEIGRELGMEPLVESHSQAQLEMCLKTDAQILGINNRNLKTFHTDLNHSKSMYNLIANAVVPRIAVCESGVRTPQDIASMVSVGYKAFLIGEALVTQQNPEQTVAEMISAATF